MTNAILVLCTGFFGDVLLTSKLTRDIKNNYSNYKVVYICDLPYTSIAANLPGVDEVIPYDRKSNSNPLNYLKFILNFPYRNNLHHAFIIHQNKMSRIYLAKLLGAKSISTWESFKNTAVYQKQVYENSKYLNIAYFNANMLSIFTNKETDDKDIEFLIPELSQQKFDKILAEKSYKSLIAINPQAGDDEKCWDVNEFIKFIKVLIKRGIKPVITGISKDGTKHIKAIENDLEIDKNDYLNMIDKTNLVELGALYKRCSFVVSIDTGASHMACAVGVPTLVLFFRNNAKLWAPINATQNFHIYNSSITAENVSSQMDRMLICPN